MNNRITKKKKVLGQYFTKADLWLKKQVIDFVVKSNCSIAYDPFAGNGDILNAVKNIDNIKRIKGLDIDKKLGWEYNDSLIDIPYVKNSIIITNPPYISNYSASRKKIGKTLKKYFDNSIYDDVYLIALDKMIEKHKYVVAIIPETFINSSYKNKFLLHSITILEENPFDDTENPVIVACFDKEFKDIHDVKVYKNEDYINTLGNIDDMRLFPSNNIKCSFNDINGWLGVRCVDTTNPNDMLRFDFKENIDYDWDKGIKVSSRLLTLIDLDIKKNKRQYFIDCCNNTLNEIREKTQDIIFSPFKGNMKNGRRRRRLDFMTCRAIIEKAYLQIN